MSRRYAAFLFDMDGTLINSIPSAVRAWTAWAERNRIEVPDLSDAGIEALAAEMLAWERASMQAAAPASGSQP